MKKWPFVSLAAAGALGLLSLAPVRGDVLAERMGKVHEGMYRVIVLQLLGNPTHIKHRGEGDYTYYYHSPTGNWAVNFENNRVESVDEP
jgi:hypothetical protein